jgi:hypothetical protein
MGWIWTRKILLMDLRGYKMSWLDYFRYGLGGDKDGATYINPTKYHDMIPQSSTQTTWVVRPEPERKIHYHCARTGRRWK